MESIEHHFHTTWRNPSESISSQNPHTEMQPINVYIFIDYSYFMLDSSLRLMTQRFDCFAELAVMSVSNYSLFYQTKVVRKICQGVTFVRLYEDLVSTLFTWRVCCASWFAAIHFHNKIINIAFEASQVWPVGGCSKCMNWKLIQELRWKRVGRMIRTL